MSIFRINNNTRFNNNNKSAIKSNLVNLNTQSMNIRSPHTMRTKKNEFKIRTLLSSGVTAPSYGTTVRNKQDDQIISVNNNAKVIIIRRDTTPIRNNLYNYYTFKFKQPIIVDKFKFCSEQKVSSVFSSSGYNQWFSSLIKNEPSFKSSVFNKISASVPSLQSDCSCIITNFEGLYTLNRTLNNNQLIYSSNRKISRANIDFNLEQNYINIYIYSDKTQSYVNIRLRPPLRYRPAYQDWVFDEDVNIIDQISSEEFQVTEYAKLIDCCNLGIIPINK
jgi:hypothetical protein